MNNRQSLFVIISVAVIAFFALLMVVFKVEKPVFYSGDGGIKYLLIKNYVQHEYSNRILIEYPEWVTTLYNDGHYPIEQPFVYFSDGEYYLVFPPYFAMLTYIFYDLLGVFGLFLIPLLSLLLIWFVYVIFLQHEFLHRHIFILSFVALVFGSPLYVYGAIFWEHISSVLLSMSGLLFFTKKDRSGFNSVLLGAIFGAAAYFRPESMVLFGLFMILMLLLSSKSDLKNVFLFGFGGTLLILSFFVVNYLLFGNILGLHGNQFLEDKTLLENWMDVFLSMSYLFLRYFPPAIIAIGLLFFLWVKNPVLRNDNKIIQCRNLFVLLMIFLIACSIMVPNYGGKQIGPRYTLILVPYIIYGTFLMLEVGKQRLRKTMYYSLLSVMLITLAYSVYFNSYHSLRVLNNDYQMRVKPGIEFLESDKTKVIIVDSQFVTQEFVHFFDNRFFFLTSDPSRVDPLLRRLYDHGTKEALFVSVAPISINQEYLFSFLNSKKGDYYFSKVQFK